MANQEIYKGFSESQTPNPSMVFVDFIVNPRNPNESINLTNFPNFTFQSFTHEYSSLNVGTGDWSITLFDPTWTDLEYYIFQEQLVFREVLFQYGYINGAHSPTYHAIASSVDSNLETQGMTLTISGQGASIVPTWTQRYETFPFLPIHQIVKKLIQLEGFQEGIIVPTKKIPHPNNASQHFPFQMQGQTFYQFINSVLIPQAVSETGLGNYQLRIDNGHYPPIVHFTPEKFNLYKALNDKQDYYKTYNYQRSERSEVISWNPKIDHLTTFAKTGSEGGGGVVKSVWIDTQTKKVQQQITDPSNPSKSQTPKQTNKKQNSTVYSLSQKNQTGRTLIYPSQHPYTVQTRQQAVLEAARSAYITGDLEILGDPSFPAWSNILLIVLTPLNQEHYTTGIYSVTKVTQTINQSFTTNLEVQNSKTQSSTATTNGTLPFNN